MLEDAPVAVGLGMLAVGLCAGMLIPRTRREDELMGDYADEMRRQMQHKSKDVVNLSKHSVEDLMSAAIREAKTQGVSLDGMKERFEHVLSETKQAFTNAAIREGKDITQKAKDVATKATENPQKTTTSAQAH